ncbi:hypothetical protein GH714_025987 [Hevea brasiliensis]|uniref:Pentacotripeptide-repeat region of PRORP domain-containing protein n=1 Tax=Hevea brasiliensis TaxID=3981 RepID=A0A6A6M8V8_HEVBR|nr:hypothetical protein GH714_025987 [Hevea brasiliensis]
MAGKGLFPSLKTCNFLLSSLVKANELKKSYEGGDAIGLFLKMEKIGVAPNVVAYNIIHGLCKNGRLDEAFQFKEKMDGHMAEALPIRDDMVSKGISPIQLLSIQLYKAFARVIKWKMLSMFWRKCCQEGDAIKNIKPNDGLLTTLVSRLCKNGNMQEAAKLLKEMLEGMILDKISYNTLILGCCKEGKLEEGFKLKEEMVKQGMQPDLYTYNLLLHGLCNKGKIEEAGMLWAECQRNGHVPNVYTYGVMRWILQSQQVEEGEKLFREMVTMKIALNSVVYNTIIRAYCKCGNMVEAFRLRHDMRSRGIPLTSATYSSLVHGLCNIGLVDNANDLLDEMRKEGLSPNIFCYTALIGGYCRLGQMDKVDSIVQEMSLHNIHLKNYLYHHDRWALQIGKYEEASKLLGEMTEKELSQMLSPNTLTNGFSKVGRVEEAFKVCDQMSSRGVSLDEITYTTLIDGWHKPSAVTNQE